MISDRGEFHSCLQHRSFSTLKEKRKIQRHQIEDIGNSRASSALECFLGNILSLLRWYYSVQVSSTKFTKQWQSNYLEYAWILNLPWTVEQLHCPPMVACHQRLWVMIWVFGSVWYPNNALLMEARIELIVGHQYGHISINLLQV